MSKYNFKEFFTNNVVYSDKIIHNSEYVSNTHFLIKKTELKNNQLEFVNNFPEAGINYNNQFSQIISSQLKMDIGTEFKPERINVGYDNNIVIMGEVGIKEGYLNFLESLKCKLFVMESDRKWNPLSIYNNDNKFVGVVLPIKLSTLNESIDYNDYLDNLKVAQEAKELTKQNSKKCLYIKDNKAVVRNKELTCLAELINDRSYNNLYIEKSDKQDVEVYIDLDVVCVFIRTIQKDRLLEDVDYYLKHLTEYTLEIALKSIYHRKEYNQFVNVADIKLVELSGATKEQVQELINYRQEWYNRKAQEDQEKKLKREQEEKEYIEDKNKLIEDLVLVAEQAILNKQEVKNQEITIYKSRYDSNDTSLILYLMKLYEIKVPLKTQGWINNALADIGFNEDTNAYNYSYYKSSANSMVFMKYLRWLIEAIENKYNISVVAK